MTKEERIEKAVEYKHAGDSCSVAALRALSDNPDEKLIDAASAFAGGMGCSESICGALAGANIVNGTVTKGTESKKKAAQLLKAFSQKCDGLIICKDLKGAKISCDDCVRYAVEAAVDVLNL